MANIDILAEHEAPRMEPSGVEQSHTPEEEKASKLVDVLFTQAKKERERFDERWLDWYRYFRGDHWKKKRAKYLHAEVINFIWQTIQSLVPIITDTRPKPTFIPQDPSDFEFSEILGDIFDSDFQHGNWMYRIAEIVYDSHIYGTGVGKLEFNPKLDFGMGRICFYRQDPFTIYPKPMVTDINDYDMTSFIVAEPLLTDDLKIKYAGHKFASKLKGDLYSFEDKYAGTKSTFKRNYNVSAPSDTYGYRVQSDAERTLVTTVYMRPRDVAEEEVVSQGPEGETKIEYVTKIKHPRGRKIVKICGYVFEDTALEMEDLSYPFAKLINYIDPGEFWGISEIEQLESPQLIFNKLISFVLDVLTFTGNPVWLIPTQSGVLPGSFHNAPGTQIPYDGDRPPTRVEGTQLQPYVLQIIDRMETWFNNVGGANDVTRGVNPPQVTAAQAIEQLQNAALTRVREKTRHVDSFLQPVGEMYAALALQNYTVPRIFRITGKDGSEKFFRFHVEHLKDEAGVPLMNERGDPLRKAYVKPFVRTEIGGYVESPESREFMVRGRFDVKINTVSGLPFSKAEKEERLLQFFDRQIIDAEELLKQIDYPNYEAVLARMQQSQMQQQGVLNDGTNGPGNGPTGNDATGASGPVA